MDTKNKTQIFISYSWSSQDVAEKIYNDLSLIGLDVIKDSHDIKYTDKISDFMKKIRCANFALLIINDEYLKSKNCMIEVLELLKDETAWEKVLPIVCSNTKIYNASDRVNYVVYWEKIVRELEEKTKVISPLNAGEIYKEQKKLNDIASNIDLFLNNLSDTLHVSPEKLFEDKYEQIINRIGIEDSQEPLIKLFEILSITNMEKRQIELDIYITKYPESTYYYSVKASTASSLGNNVLAKHYYEKALEFDSFNYEALNNLGQLVEIVFKDYYKAREYYERAIKSKPELDIPRLNLGVLLSRYLDDIYGAKKVYEDLLKIDPENAKAHNNIAGIYRSEKINDYKKVEYHFKKALEINPNYLDAYINYGNFLKMTKKQKEEGNSYYMKALSICKNVETIKFLEMLINSDKA
ncbi:MAG: hypothetical protein H6Q15_1148 [Bacteroidetes bacterium]|nr:hypothetical protein [Bacteroidota bacterium]